MKEILFVEDNEVLLQFYNMLVSTLGDQWTVTTAPSAEAALDQLSHKTFDVVASDMQMPGKSGLELLLEVRQLHPQTSRIIISGSGDQAIAADSLKSIHQFLPKPIDLKTLKATLDRIVSLDAFLKDDKLRLLASTMPTLPSFPSLYLEVIQELESPSSTIESISEIITHDPGITVKILQVVNSAASGMSHHVSDPVEAVQQLGFNTIRSLVLSAQVFSSFSAAQMATFSADALWSHLMKCGRLARSIMQEQRASVAECDEAYTAGILHDMGKLMLASGMPEEFHQALLLSEQEQIPLQAAERSILGADHSALAAYLFGLWGLPASIVESVAFHHTPEKSSLQKFTPLTAVHVANALQMESAGQVSDLNLDYLARLGVADKLEDWRALATELQMAAPV